MASPPLCIAILVVNETSSSVTVPLTKQGPCSDRARPGPTPEAIPKIHGFGPPVRPRNRLKTLKENLCECWQRLAGPTTALPKFRVFLHSRCECGTDDRRPGVPTRSNIRELLRERQKVPHLAIFPSPLAWIVSPLGSSARRPMSHTASRGLASAEILLPVLKR